jgi:hypothetical protein
VALESENSESISRVVLEREEWLDYFFGICKPDRRNGKQGSRCWCCLFWCVWRG